MGDNPEQEAREIVFWAKAKKTEACWLWTGWKNSKGYGVVWRGRGVSKQMAHRVAYGLVRGAIPNGSQVLHHCDAPACVRPDHLFLGTNADNMADMKAKGRGRIHGIKQQTEKQRGQTSCVNGHEYTPENTYRWGRTGRRRCRACNLEGWRRRSA